MVEFEKYTISKIENSLNLGAYRFCKILSILRSAHIMPRDNNGNIFYNNNYID